MVNCGISWGHNHTDVNSDSNGFPFRHDIYIYTHIPFMMDVPDVLYVYWEPHFFGSNIKDGNRIKRTGLQSRQKVYRWTICPYTILQKRHTCII
jgi:hypothetical protein